MAARSLGRSWPSARRSAISRSELFEEVVIRAFMRGSGTVGHDNLLSGSRATRMYIGYSVLQRGSCCGTIFRITVCVG